MKSTTKTAGLFLTTFIIIFSISCEEENLDSDVSLENTSWRLIKETWYFPSGDSLIFDKSGDHDGHFYWNFETDSTLKINYKPYSSILNAYWEKKNNTLAIKTKITTDSIYIQRYTILGLEESNMILNVENVNGVSNDKGEANAMLYELKRQ